MNNKELDLRLNNFEGPLDLLLLLVREKKMDIFEIDLIELASWYISIINSIKENNINLAIEYLVMAATLINMKAKALLETPKEKKEVEETKSELLKKLVARQQFKNLAHKLRKKEQDRKDIFFKNQDDISNFQTPIDESHLDGNVDPIKMIIALRKMFERVHAMKLKETKIEKFNFSPAQRRLEIIQLFKSRNNITYKDIFQVPTINHFVITILTILDMSRKQELIITQDCQYGIINITKGVINGI